MFCFVKDNNIIYGIVNTITEPNLSGGVDRATTYCQQIFRKTSKLSYYFYIANICKV